MKKCEIGFVRWAEIKGITTRGESSGKTMQLRNSVSPSPGERANPIPNTPLAGAARGAGGGYLCRPGAASSGALQLLLLKGNSINEIGVNWGMLQYPWLPRHKHRPRQGRQLHQSTTAAQQRNTAPRAATGTPHDALGTRRSFHRHFRRCAPHRAPAQGPPHALAPLEPPPVTEGRGGRPLTALPPT